MNKHQRSPLSAAIIMALAANSYADSPIGNQTKEAGYTFSLDKVTVAATLTEQKIEDVANTVTVIDQEAMNRASATDIRDMLRYEPGVEVGSSGRFGLDGFNIRGMDGNQVKIVVDGVDQSKAFNPGGDFQQVNRNLFDIDAMKQVDIVKGPASSLYGSNAIGGVVSFTTKDPYDYLSASGDDSYGSLKTQYTSENEGTHTTATLANRSGQLESLLVYTHRDYKETDNQGSVGGEGESRTKANPLDSRSDNILAKLQYQINDAHRVGLTFEQNTIDTDINNLRGNYVNDFSVFFGNPAGTDGIAYSDNRSEDAYERTRIGFEHEWQAGLSAFDSLSWSYNQQETISEHNTFDSIVPFGWGAFMVSGDGPRENNYSNEEDSKQLTAQFVKAINNHTITYGFNWENTDAVNETGRVYTNGSSAPETNRYYPKVESESRGIFIQDQISLLNGSLTLTPAVRYDEFEAKPKADAIFDEQFDKHDSDKISGRLGAVYKLNQDWAVFGQYAQGFKTPDLGDMYYARNGGDYLSLSNPDLKPEESDSFEVGVRFQSEVASVEVSAFYNDYKNFIDTVELGTQYDYNGDGDLLDGPGVDDFSNGVTQRVNISEATIKGIELRSSVWLDETLGAPSGTSLTASIAYADGEGKSDQEGTEPLNSIAPLKAVFGLDYQAPNGTWGSTLSWTLVDGKDSSDLPDISTDTNPDVVQFATPGYGLVDLTAFYKPMEQLTISGGIYNLGDKKYWVHEDVRGVGVGGLDGAEDYIDRYTQPGRNFSVSAVYSF
ncbi:MAG: TonB-dependent hemoglobin/transferrin/lactoferrin family receptor [Candidatus Pelagadaptatus aseana]|uniref:TonB-dependent hemoglobin/transferrin/lactoferrin family receptor n=1 Tax=Candidatus Pelagadaptatus aseana TaxID=3120508 RepID=UPI0039B307BE